MKSATVFLEAARKVSFTLGALLALCLTAFASMGGVASAHTMPSQPNVQVNAQVCKQSAQSNANLFPFTNTQQVQICIFTNKSNLKHEHEQAPGNSNNQGSHPSHKKVNVQVCKQSAQSNANLFPFINTQQVQICIFNNKLNLKHEHEGSNLIW